MNEHSDNIGEELRGSARQALRFLKWLIPVLALFYLGDGFYTIGTNEIGVREFMGRVVDRQVMPGLHYTLPRPFGRIHKVPVMRSESVVIDDFFQDPAPGSRASIFKELTGLESYALSGDNNTVEIKVIVHYRYTDPFEFLFGATRKEVLMRDIVCREIIHLLAVRPVDLILTRGREMIRGALHQGIQERLDRNRTGITVDRVDIREIRPPVVVQRFFDDVINAQIDRKQMESRAHAFATDEVAQARADADRRVQEAAAYRRRVVEEATGESERFLELLDEYRKVPEITRKRLYLEFARDTLGRLKNTYLIDHREETRPPRPRIMP